MKLVREIIGRRPLRPVLRPVVKKLSLLPYRDRLELNWIDRPYYGHCIFEAAQLAARLHVPRISVIEFGCGGGNGLINAEMHISEAKKIFPVDFELYGFDTGAGMPAPQDYRDFPHYFKPGLYKMDPELLKRKLRFAKLVLGPVKETCNTFISEYEPAPIGCIFMTLIFILPPPMPSRFSTQTPLTFSLASTCILTISRGLTSGLSANLPESCWR